jgi:hypothetical protein
MWTVGRSDQDAEALAFDGRDRHRLARESPCHDFDGARVVRLRTRVLCFGQPVYERRRNQDSGPKESRGLHLSDPVGLKSIKQGLCL